MLSALGQLLPIAVAVAVSSVPITATILILLSPKRNRSAIPFLIGWVVGMAAVVVVAATRGQRPPRSDPLRAPQKAIGIAQIIVGLALLVVAVMAWRRAARAPADKGSRWLDRVDRMGPAAALGLAVALNLRPKGLLLGAAAGLSIAGASLTDDRCCHRRGHLCWSRVVHGHRSDRRDAHRAGSDAASPGSGTRLAQPQQRTHHCCGPGHGRLRDLGRWSQSALGPMAQVRRAWSTGSRSDTLTRQAHDRLARLRSGLRRRDSRHGQGSSRH